MNNKFEEVYDSMTDNYSRLETVIADLYQYLQSNPSDEVVRSTIGRLSSIGDRMLSSQRDFTEYYAEQNEKTNLIAHLDSKIESLSKSTEEFKSKSM